jgi:DNA replication protein DnaC
MSADPLEILLRSFRLPTMAERFEEMITDAESQNWGYRKLLLNLCEAEALDRKERRQQRCLKDACLPMGKIYANLEEKQLPTAIRRQLPTLLERKLCEQCGQPAGLRASRTRQNALPERIGS